MKEINLKAQAIVDKYSERLATYGVTLSISRKYLETSVFERSSGRASMLNAIERARDRKTEKEKGYNYVRNRHHFLVLSLTPVDRCLVPRDARKEYSFIVREIIRAHIGQEPRLVEHNEEKLLAKIEKRILKILKKLKKTSAEQVCRDSLFDVLRYCASPKYAYKDKFLGKSSTFWDSIFVISLAILLLVILFVAWVISQ